jgi:hypothetical protein
MKRCRHCKEPFTPIRSTLEKYCSKSECLRVFVEEAKAKDWAKRKAKLKKEAMTLSDWVKIAQQVFNAYIRERDKDRKCISCGKVPKKINAGHYFNANNHWSVRFDERNVHLQCEYCNTYLSANLILYTPALMAKIGQDQYEDLCNEARKTRKFTIDELKEITATYKKKLKELKQISK